jgi:uncharacterized membrane protein YdjX (TVP38/TMEM64 family)
VSSLSAAERVAVRDATPLSTPRQTADMPILSGVVGWLSNAGAWSPVLFVAVYVLATVALLPGSVLTLLAGAVFGVARAMLVVFIGAVLGSSLAFGIARRLAHRYVAAWLSRDARLSAVTGAVRGHGASVVFLLRLSPLVPYNVLNYALGLTDVRFRDFLIGSVGMLPGTLLYVYSGKVIGDVAAIAAGVAPPKGAAYYGLLSGGLVATALVTVVIARAARAALAEHSSSTDG